MVPFKSTFFVILIFAMPALAADLPARKGGLWEMKTTTSDGRTFSMQECVDAQSDQAMQSTAVSTSRRACSKRDVQKSGDGMTIDSLCKVAGKTMTNHTVITGNFDSSYTMVITNQSEGKPAGRPTTVVAKWTGPCAAGQKPGDMTMPDGTKMNLLDAEKGMGQPGAPGATPPH